MRNKYAGVCLCCREQVAAGAGYFQRDNGRWLVRCVKCVGKGNRPAERRAREMTAELPEAVRDVMQLKGAM